MFTSIYRCSGYRAFGNVYIKPFKCTVYNYYNAKTLNPKDNCLHAQREMENQNISQNNLKKRKEKNFPFRFLKQSFLVCVCVCVCLIIWNEVSKVIKFSMRLNDMSAPSTPLSISLSSHQRKCIGFPAYRKENYKIYVTYVWILLIENPSLYSARLD